MRLSKVLFLFYFIFFIWWPVLGDAEFFCGCGTWLVIGEAFAVLSDPERRRRYDLLGPENTSSLRAGAPSDGGFPSKKYQAFQADISPEEMAHMFFTGHVPASMSGDSEEGVGG